VPPIAVVLEGKSSFREGDVDPGHERAVAIDDLVLGDGTQRAPLDESPENRTSAGLPGARSSVQTSRTDRRRARPGHRAPARLRAAMIASAVVRSAQMAWSTSSSRPGRSSTHAHSTTARDAEVHGMPSTVARSTAGTSLRCRATSGVRALDEGGTETCGSNGALQAACSAALVRWLARASVPQRRTPAMALRRHVGGPAPGRR
jgi:hypothetical protein